METLKTIPAEIAALIPKYQLEVTTGNLKAFTDVITELETALKNAQRSVKQMD